MSPSPSLKDNIAIVTGAGGGLGREYALLLASLDARVVVNDYGGTVDGSRGTITRAQSVVDEIKALGGHALADGHDISVQTEVKELVRATVEAFRTVHIVVNNAGIAGQMSAHDAVNVESFTWTWRLRHWELRW
jgi:NAD(P)-dependent dehydrogenase (short-subunit alcohol dehydrogenase family)